MLISVMNYLWENGLISKGENLPLRQNLLAMKNRLVVLVFAGCFLASYAHAQSKEDKWIVPENYQAMKNPVPSDEASIKAGKQLYQEHCVSCHGKKGLGDGTRAKSLDVQPSDLTTDAFQKQTDGSILYKIYFGHKDMPGFKTKIPDNEDVIEGSFGKTRSPGDLINYLRTLAKTKPAN